MSTSFKIDNDKASDLLWLDESEGYLDVAERPADIFFFGVFYLDKLCGEPLKRLGNIKEQLNKLVEVWNKNYPWANYGGVRIEIVERSGEIPFIFGYVDAGGHREEEYLVVCLLQRLSETLDEYTFIKACGSDGEILLMECHDLLPEEYEFPKGNNRLWLHEGRFKFIPAEELKHRGLWRDEALTFLMNSYFKLTDVSPSIDRRLKELIGTEKFPEKYLDEMFWLPLNNMDVCSSNILRKDPQLISLAVRAMSDTDVDKRRINEFTKVTNNSTAKVLISKSQARLILAVLESLGLDQVCDNVSSIVGALMSESLSRLIDKEEIVQPKSQLCSDGQSQLVKHFKDQRLISEDYEISSVNFSSLSLENNTHDSDADPTSRLEGLFSDLRKHLETDNRSSAEEYPHSDDDSDSVADREALNYFSTENIDIDEDDFFEFFLTEALKLNKNELEDYRRQLDPSTEANEGTSSSEEERRLMAELDGHFGKPTSSKGGVGLSSSFDELSLG
ncbi:LADA_0C07074g1_1 [Lachancea dasiensis]|uniref:LADA_0C07074g1_1 n=1 Tax=Lachancea dasiensis TaxID=1072105 RepID=A0A1G4IZG3_9SACH|nr:LADA_0C07074g1_1 [Lachancea dasiensis]